MRNSEGDLDQADSPVNYDTSAECVMPIQLAGHIPPALRQCLPQQRWLLPWCGYVGLVLSCVASSSSKQQAAFVSAQSTRDMHGVQCRGHLILSNIKERVHTYAFWPKTGTPVCFLVKKGYLLSDEVCFARGVLAEKSAHPRTYLLVGKAVDYWSISRIDVHYYRCAAGKLYLYYVAVFFFFGLCF